MQTIIEYLLQQLESEEIEEIDVQDVHNFLQYLVGNEMPADQIVEEIGLYELELTRVAFEGHTTSTFLGRLLTVPSVAAQRYVVGL